MSFAPRPAAIDLDGAARSAQLLAKATADTVSKAAASGTPLSRAAA
jgi:hypothetical protein